jgi:isoamylase
LDWNLSPRARRFLDFTGQVVAIRMNNPVLRRRSFFTGRAISREGVKDLAWLRPDGHEMGDADWSDATNQVLGMLIHGQATDEVDERGRPIFGDTLLVLLNGGYRSRLFMFPAMEGPGLWQEVLNTARPETGPRVVRTQAVNLVAHSLILLRFGEELRPTP